MQYNLLKTGLFLVAVTFVANTAKVNALSPELALVSKPTNIISKKIAEETKQEKEKSSVSVEPKTEAATSPTPVTSLLQKSQKGTKRPGRDFLIRTLIYQIQIL